MPEQQPLVTIVTPTYNRASFLPETIESILHQTYPHIEHLIVDDGSTDDTGAVVARYTSKHPERIRYIHKPNGGEASATNRGWHEARGAYFGVVCSDDPQPAELIARCVEALAADPQAIVVYPDWLVLDADGRMKHSITVAEYTRERLVGRCQCFVGPGAIIRRSAVYARVPELRDPRFVCVSDFSAWLRLSLLGPFRRVPHVVGAWREHPHGATNIYKGRRIAKEHVDLIDDFFRRTDLPPDVRRLERDARRNINRIAADMVGPRDRKQYVSYRVRTLWYQPVWRTAWHGARILHSLLRGQPR